MTKHTIEQKLSDSRPEATKDNETFIARTMESVGKSGVSATFEKVVRTKGVTKKESLIMKLRQFKKRLHQMPRYAAALFILGTTGTVGAAAYATYKWINPEVTITNVQEINDDDKKQYTVDSQCGEFRSGKALQYEVSRSSGLTEEDVYTVFNNTCAYSALRTFTESRWKNDDAGSDAKVGDVVTMYYSDNLFAGSTKSNEIFGLTIGRVTGISANEVSFALPIYAVDNTAGSRPEESPFEYYPNGKEFSRTLKLAPNVEVWADGKQLKLADVKLGDMIQVVVRTQNKLQYYEDIKQISLGEQVTFDVAGIVKTDIDTKYVSDYTAQIGDPKIVNAVTVLSPCHNNDEYLCVFPPKQIIGPVYSAGDEVDKSNLKYLRPDVTDETKVKYYELHGRVIKIEGTRLIIETRGKKTTFTVELPYDAVAEYNKPESITTSYDESVALKLEVGDMLQVHYAQSDSEDHLVIKPGDLQMLAVLEQLQPDGTFTKY